MSPETRTTHPNKRPRASFAALAALALATAAAAAAAPAAPLAPAQGLHPALADAGLTLELRVNGAAVDVPALQRSSGSRQLRLVLTRAASSDKVGRALLKPLGQAAIEGSFVRCVLKLGQAFGKRQGFQRGDEIVFEHEAEEPLSLRINQQLVSGALCEREFMPLLAGHWLGMPPVRPRAGAAAAAAPAPGTR
jgi:hypothetical protein